jgi:hypothetical protein
MKKPFRDKHGRFAKRPKPKKRKKRHVKRLRTVVTPTRKTTSRVKKTLRIRPRKISTLDSSKRKTLSPPKKTRTKTTKEWEPLSVSDILDIYIETYDLDEDNIGDYRDPLQHLYEYLRSVTFRHASTYVVSKNKMIPWKSKPFAVQIWFLVHYHHRGDYNIEFRVWENEDRVTLKTFVESIHAEFISIQNQIFQRERTLTYKNSEAIHLIALLPIMKAPPPRKTPYFHKNMREGQPRKPIIYRFTPPPKRRK